MSTGWRTRDASVIDGSLRSALTKAHAFPFRSKLATRWPASREKGYDLDYIFEEGLRWQVGTVNIKSVPIPNDWKGQFNAFQKKIGYRFNLRRLEYSRVVAPGTMMPIHI